MARHARFQIELCRERLAAYRNTYAGEGRPVLTWHEVSLDIADITKKLIPAERLRQFVEGASRKSGKGPSMLSPDRFDAVKRFLLDEEIAMIHEREWNGEAAEHDACVVLRIPYEDYCRLDQAGVFSGCQIEPLSLPKG